MEPLIKIAAGLFWGVGHMFSHSSPDFSSSNPLHQLHDFSVEGFKSRESSLL